MLPNLDYGDGYGEQTRHNSGHAPNRQRLRRRRIASATTGRLQSVHRGKVEANTGHCAQETGRHTPPQAGPPFSCDHLAGGGYQAQPDSRGLQKKKKKT